MLDSDGNGGSAEKEIRDEKIEKFYWVNEPGKCLLNMSGDQLNIVEKGNLVILKEN